MSEESKLAMLRTEIRIALSHPETDSYITSKVSVIFRILSNLKMTDETKKAVEELKVEFDGIRDPFDWHKNLIDASALYQIVRIVEELKELFDA